MKRNLVCIMLLLIATTLVYADLMEQTEMFTPVHEDTEPNLPPRTRNRQPDFTFNIDPVSIATSYYDYFPGSYDSVPIRIQPSPAGMHEGGGIYIAYQATPEAGGVRRVNYVYIDDGAITGQGLIDGNAPAHIAEGFPNLDIDQDTGNPLFAWHKPSDADPAILEVLFNFDQYSTIGFPGVLSESYTVIHNPYEIGMDPLNAFIWPSVFIGPSPNEGMKRVYIIGKNHQENPHEYPIENEMIAFADYEDISELASYDPDSWTNITIPQMDDWRANNIRAFRSRIVTRDDGTVAIVGHTTKVGEDIPAYHEDVFLFVLENNNYGEGEWELFTGDPYYMVENPVDPATNQGYFTGEGDNPYQDMRYMPYVSRFNLEVDDHGNYHFPAMYALMTEERTWYPNLTTTRHVKFDREAEEFIVSDLYPTREGQDFYLPWDTPPQWHEEFGHLLTNASYPNYWWNVEDLFHENYHRIISDGPYMVALVQESIKARLFNEFQNENYEDWANKPETYIFVSNDYGENWSDPIIMHSNPNDPDGNYVPELDGMVPSYWYIADDIEMISDDWGRIHLMFMDNNTYGSSIQGNSPPTGGTIMYTSLDIQFGEGEVFVERDIEQEPSVAMLQGNYPNPFNPNTTIAYTLPETSDVNLSVYNVKGQLVKNLVDERIAAGERYATWNGTDDQGREVGSGVYFYKLTVGNHSETERMILMK